MRFDSVHEAGRPFPLHLALAAVAVMLVPYAAGAQSYAVTQQPIVYEELPIGGGTVTSLSGGQMFGGDSGIFEVQVTLPFAVNFFGTPETNLFVSANGFVTLGNAFHATSTIPREIPGTTPPHNLIAVWWDHIVCDSEFSGVVNGPVLTQIVGEEPNRAFVVQWTKCRKYASSGAWFNAQLWLFENSSRIEAHYGDVDPGTLTEFRASMGVEDSTGTDGTPGISALGVDCNPGCTAADFPSNTALVYTAGPVLQVSSFVGDEIGAPELPIHATAIVDNVGGEDAIGIDARFWLSDGPTLAGMTHLLSTAPAIDIPAGVSVSFDLNEPLPSPLPDGAYWLIVEVDTAGAVGPEPIAAVWGPFSVAVASPDVALYSVVVPPRLDEGQDLDLQWTVRNLGLVEATDVAYVVTLASTTTEDEWILDEGSFDLSPNQTKAMNATLALPEGLEGGRYVVRIDVDPDDLVGDVIRSNNQRTSLPFVIASELLILTTSLPMAETEKPYSVLLDVVGGDGTYAWKVASGSTLPPGLSLQADGSGMTRLSGTPGQAGTFEFTLEVESMGLEAEATYSLQVIEVLRVDTAELPEATVGIAYSAGLVARGGVEPYEWSVVDGALPPGLVFLADGGVEGTPEAEFDGEFTVQVQDSLGTTAERTVSLFVNSSTGVFCSATPPSEALVIGTPAAGFTLDAGGGKAPYTWSTSRSVRVADELAEAITRSAEPPPGLELKADGTIGGTPVESGTYEWTLRATDARGKTGICETHFVVEADRPLSIGPDELPDAEVGSAYEVKLVTDAEGWYSFSLGKGSELPIGLTLKGTGVISGTPAREQLLGEAKKSFTFDVQVVDGTYRFGTRTLTLPIVDPEHEPSPGGNGGGSGSKSKEKKSGGCQSAGGELGLLGLAVIAGIAILRRRP
ncbi:MAG TPA: Ig domain-containing protein [Vulgatibacter sp.]|nr:Ig domain-containing protein [Vulgatibacter sp.]